MTMESCLSTARVTQLSENAGFYDRNSRLFVKIVLNEMKIPFEHKNISTNPMEYGRLLKNGSWTGMYGQFQRNTADVIYASARPHPDEIQVADFSEPFMHDKIQIDMHKLNSEEKPFATAVFYPIRNTMWVSIAGVILLVTILMLFLLNKLPCNSFLSLLGSLSKQPMKVKDSNLRGRFFVSGWLGFTTIITLCYSAVLLSFLVAPIQPMQIDNFRQLAEAVKREEMVVIVRKHYKIHEFLMKSKEEHLNYLGKKITSKNWFIENLSNWVYFRHLLTPTSVFLYEQNFKLPGWSSRHLSTEILYTSSTTVASRKGFCGSERINTIVSRLNAAGIMEKIISWTEYPQSLERYEKLGKPKPRPLNLNDLSGSFMVLLCGYVLSILVFFGEIFYNRLK